jgi:hypothetical protein
MKRASFITLSACALVAPSRPALAAPMPDVLLSWARSLVEEVTPENNFYGSHPTYVEWADTATGRAARNRSVCSSFASHLLEHSFGYTPADIDAWFGKHVPQAREYHDTIAARNGFLRIEHVTAIRAGDIVAVKYPDGSHPTGHVMIAASRAVPRMATAPVREDTQQYELEVIDSANSGHGPADTRHHRDAPWTTGVGHGILRLYANPDETLAGYSWSTTPKSLYRSTDVRAIAIGRLDPDRVPRPSGSPGSSASPDEETETSPDDASSDS